MLQLNDIELLSQTLTFWPHLTKPQKDLIIQNALSVHFSKGQSLHCTDLDCIGVLIVKNGMIRTYITSEEGREVTLYRLNEKDVCILSASCVLQTIEFEVSVDAETDCDVIQINPMIFSRLMSENIYVELFSYKRSTERFSDVMWVMQEILFTSFDKRLVIFLLDESTKAKTNDIHMTHEQIAKYLGTAREVVSRMLKYFSKEGYVSLSRGGITLLDKEALRRVLDK